ncbi:hypothetical protein CBW24_04315 [Pacificitalea manganoxidans]|uniref:Holin-X, holin superfamily III n=1 Tax=Pacificitalea manganoxidans TaxID=1411902 RepID=A0A291LX81_9RHOB|nr:hypothetical protein [Pacificitalea manganoxidans]ATI41302.1 hypothetical protein CBW24_04315 [Pacificitalea manganoxidans]MDR6308698.1 Zn-dependent protease with chaperone function [Pacificitalea manganoxidans]
MLALLERKGILYAQKAVLGLLSLVSLLVGVVFLTIAAWIYLASVTNAVAASLIMGAIFVILALLLLIMSMRRGRRYVMPTAAPVTGPPVAAPAPMGIPGASPLANAFVIGLQAGITAVAAAKRKR